MGAEFRIEISPPVVSLDAACDNVFEKTNWKRIEHHSAGPEWICVQEGKEPLSPAWPNVVDIRPCSDGTYYAVAHCNSGVQFLHALKDRLESNGHSILLDDDYY